ncbi:CDP-diacylglycerol--glycerol-3-phosphate 3-phosphatidyltransferase [Candidatus Oleimmundimicrobium sp.]|uniref:CDP-diacylglycerol--glycerol-3-phosphate 3-phosphatidyltransferase n=1 Tax=Candidatus Oleimmundimicrobium sp. TaxID=3060597 RepID=UPI0027245CBE|nr:CDP-diacylglycerol--glycerol-3-phosphate 3-phosphatidyltransferase [Candidatus Oleimmundimicrobium sp.]MDO8885432.1 CDP-diacylglycerol--glycerol-3-phosphate 3-phosphatidyltransferase [Candidatus Oleimmundimicrobium sp.]
MLNTANKITILRILLIPVFMAFLLSNIKYGNWISIGIFIVAAMSDGLDGYIARSKGLVTVFGKFLDPLADKLLISAALISLVDLNLLSAWIATAIIAREFLVSGLRLMAIAENKVIAASIWGKLKTISQIVMVIALIVLPNTLLTYVILIVAIFFTFYSGIDYFIKSIDIWMVRGREPSEL